MKRGLLTTFICIIVAAVIVVTVMLFINSLQKPTVEPTPDTDQTQTDTPPEPSIGESDEPTNNTPEVEDNGESDGEQTQTTPSAGDVTTPTTGDTGTPSAGNEVTVPVGVPTSYKEFSLTKDMDAKDAYEYLNSFLLSKYSILLNKQNKVSEDYQPTDLITPSGCSYPMERTAGNALVTLLQGARQDGISDLILYSGYRTVASQKNKYVTRTNKYLSQGYSQQEAEAKAGEYIAPPGASEHHTGLAADVCSSAIVNKYGYLSDDFDTTKEYRWMKEHCAEYGFIIRYTKGDEEITGYSYEPWHLRYLGKEHAGACTELDITYEEYHAMLVKFRDEAKADAGV